jgi:hypothetical protein
VTIIVCAGRILTTVPCGFSDDIAAFDMSTLTAASGIEQMDNNSDSTLVKAYNNEVYVPAHTLPIHIPTMNPHASNTRISTVDSVVLWLKEAIADMAYLILRDVSEHTQIGASSSPFGVDLDFVCSLLRVVGVVVEQQHLSHTQLESKGFPSCHGQANTPIRNTDSNGAVYAAWSYVLGVCRGVVSELLKQSEVDTQSQSVSIGLKLLQALVCTSSGVSNGVWLVDTLHAVRTHSVIQRVCTHYNNAARTGILTQLLAVASYVCLYVNSNAWCVFADEILTAVFANAQLVRENEELIVNCLENVSMLRAHTPLLVSKDAEASRLDVCAVECLLRVFVRELSQAGKASAVLEKAANALHYVFYRHTRASVPQPSVLVSQLLSVRSQIYTQVQGVVTQLEDFLVSSARTHNDNMAGSDCNNTSGFVAAHSVLSVMKVLELCYSLSSLPTVVDSDIVSLVEKINSPATSVQTTSESEQERVTRQNEREVVALTLGPALMRWLEELFVPATGIIEYACHAPYRNTQTHVSDSSDYFVESDADYVHTLLLWYLICLKIDAASAVCWNVRAIVGSYMKYSGVLKIIVSKLLAIGNDLTALGSPSVSVFNPWNNQHQNMNVEMEQFLQSLLVVRTSGPQKHDDLDHKLVTQLTSLTLHKTVLCLPAMVRYFNSNDANRIQSALLAKFIESFARVSILRREIQLIDKIYASSGTFGGSSGLTVVGSLASGEITAVFVPPNADDEATKVEMKIRLPTCYPLKNVEVDCNTKLGLINNSRSANSSAGSSGAGAGAGSGDSSSRNRRWVLQIIQMLAQQDGNVMDAVLLWKRNVEKEFEGVEACPICYSILHPKNMCIPSLACPTCNNKFHNECLYTWFKSSGKSKCVICQQPFFQS